MTSLDILFIVLCSFLHPSSTVPVCLCVCVCVCVCVTTTDLIGMCEIASVELDASWAGQSTKWLALCQKEGAPPDPSLGEIQIAIRWEQQSYDA